MKRMWKVFTLALVLAFAGVGAVFAQEVVEEEEIIVVVEQTAKVVANAVSLDLFPLFKGFIAADTDAKTSFFAVAASFERIVAPHFTFGVELDLFPGSVYDVDYVYFGLSAAGRYYPLSESFDQFFMGAALGFNVLSIDGKSSSDYGGFAGLTTALRAGYKLIFANRIFMEPSMGYVLSKTSQLSMIAPLGWQGGLRIGYVF